MWAVLAVVGAGMLLTAMQVIVTQLIRLRASARITSSKDALRVLEIEDLPHHRKTQELRASQALPRQLNEQRIPASRRPGGRPSAGGAAEEMKPI
jgi:hypothetical protein